MSRNRKTDPDLYPTAAVRKLLAPLTDQPAKTPVDPPRHVLPKNLPEAIRQLTDQELDRLLAAALAEREARGGKKPPVSDAFSGRSPSKENVPDLPQGKLNAVRAAFKAGVKPSQIARQFGISPSDVRKALAPDDSKR